MCVGSVIRSEHIQTHPEASLTPHRNVLTLRHQQTVRHRLRPDSAPDPDPALNIALACSNCFCLVIAPDDTESECVWVVCLLFLFDMLKTFQNYVIL